MVNNYRSYLWNYFEKSNDKMAFCTLCKQLISYKSTVSNLKVHLKRKHFSVYSELKPRLNRKQNQHDVTEPSCSLSYSLDGSTHVIPVILDSYSISSEQVTPTNSELQVPKRQKVERKHVAKNITTGTELKISHVAKNITTEPKISHAKSITTEMKNKIDADLLDLFILDFQPFQIVEDVAFKKLLKWIPGYELPSINTISSEMIPAEYHRVLSSVRETMRDEANSICITTDMWTSNNMKSYLAVTAHYLDNDFNSKTVLLQCSNLLGNHTATELADELKRIITDWNLINKINFAVSDNTSTIVKAIEDILKWKHYGCYGRKLNSIVQTAISKMETIINKVKKIVYFFKKNANAADELLKYQSANGSCQIKVLILEVSTKWNSVFYMIERFIELEESVKALIAVIDEDLPVISIEEWKALKDLCIILKPFEEMTMLISREKYMTGSSVIVITKCLLNLCKKIEESEEFSNFSELVKKTFTSLKAGLLERLKNIEHNTTFSLCTFLDPRYKNGIFSDSSAAEKAKKNVIEMVSQVIKKKSISTPVTVRTSVPEISNLKTTPKVEVASTTTFFVNAWDVFNEIIVEQNALTKSTPLTRAIKEVDTYLAHEIFPLKNESGEFNSQLDWWKKHQYVYPNLATIFKTKCNAVATSTPCEQIFYKNGFLNDRRKGLTTGNVEMLIFLNANVSS